MTGQILQQAEKIDCCGYRATGAEDILWGWHVLLLVRSLFVRLSNKSADSRWRIRVFIRTFRSMHAIGILKLNWRSSSGARQFDFLEDAIQTRIFENRQIAAFLTLNPLPPHK